VAYAVLLLVAVYGSGLPDQARSARDALLAATGASAVAALGISAVQLVTGDALLPRFVVFGAALAVVPWSLACWLLARGGRLRAEGRDRVVLVAAAPEAVVLGDELEGAPERPAVLLNHLLVADCHPRPDRARPLVELVTDIRANLVVLDRSALDDPVVVTQAASLHEDGVRVRTLSQFYDEWLGKFPMSELERVSMFFDISELHGGGGYGRWKRLLDVLLGAAAAVVFVLVVPLVLLGNVAGNRGPLLYRQERVGKGGRPFTMVKFRTMVPGAGDGDGSAGAWTQRDDPRITRFGRLLRTTHLDELPQGLNILRGDLSVVGPRPEQPHYVDELVAKIPFYDLRHLVRPGLTGWAQVKYGYAGDEQDAVEKLQYDFWYLRHQSLALDARILGRTIRSTVGGAGAGR
ncbi:MAG TPA: sugar transferase, partial [Acidimicrobiales bacterium]|nr:sugar transferase [Acidimicrobiales bacterium]